MTTNRGPIGGCLVAIIIACTLLACCTAACGQGFSEGQRWQEYTFRGGYWWRGSKPYRLSYYNKWGKRYARAYPVKQPDITINYQSFNSQVPSGSALYGYPQDASVPNLSDLLVQADAIRTSVILETTAGLTSELLAVTELAYGGQQSLAAQAIAGNVAYAAELAKGAREQAKLAGMQQIFAQLTQMMEAVNAGDVDAGFTIQVQPTGTLQAAASTGFASLDVCANCHSGSVQGGGHVLFPLSLENQSRMTTEVMAGRMPRVGDVASPLDDTGKVQFALDLSQAMGE